MNSIALDLGFVQIYWYSITMLLAIFSGTALAYFEIKKQKGDLDFFYNLVFYTVLVSILGARIYYVVFNLSYYLNNPIEILEIWNGGLAIHGAILFGSFFIIYYTKKHKKNTLKIFDIITSSLMLGQVIGRWGNFFNGEAHGGPVARIFLEKLHLPNFIINGMNVGGVYYQPTFLYESLWNLLGLIVILILKNKNKFKTGQVIGFYLMWYSFIRFFIEGMRTDSLMLGSIKVAQLVSILLLGLGAYIFIKNNKEKRVNKYSEETKYE